MSWRDLAKKAIEAESSRPPEKPGIPAFIFDGVRSIQRPHPRVRDQAAWREVAEDAARLLNDGWVERATLLGWQPLDLFGISADGGGDYEGLAVWLRGDALILMDGSSAVAAHGQGRRVFNRTEGAKNATFIWDFGR